MISDVITLNGPAYSSQLQHLAQSLFEKHPNSDLRDVELDGEDGLERIPSELRLIAFGCSDQDNRGSETEIKDVLFMRNNTTRFGNGQSIHAERISSSKRKHELPEFTILREWVNFAPGSPVRFE